MTVVHQVCALGQGVSGCLSALVVSMMLASTCAAQAQGLPQLNLILQVNGSTPVNATLNGSILPNGHIRYTGQQANPGSWTLNWNVTADTNPVGNASLNGTIYVINHTASVNQYTLTATVPMCGRISGSTITGGQVVVSMVSNPGGGAITVPAGQALWTARMDGQTVSSLFHGPFSLTATGPASSSTDDDFGLPGLTLTSQPLDDSLGLRMTCSVTPGERVTFNNNFIVSRGISSVIIPDVCMVDFNHDAAVNATDLAVLLNEWGSCDSNCAPDLNGDGAVNAIDMSLLLSLWHG